MSDILFSVFIPTYNRGHVICRALDSIKHQTVDDWEIIVVDDGSTDNTHDVVLSWARTNSIDVRYHYQKNSGKHVAHNKAVRMARGSLFVVLDSDDIMIPDALQIMRDAWFAIEPEKKIYFAGVEGLCLTGRGDLHGTGFEAEYVDASYLEMLAAGMKGEKRNALRVDVLKAYPYPEFSGEYHVRPDYVWKRIAHQYNVRFINKPVQIVDFAVDGLTATSSSRRLKNIKGLFWYWYDDVHYHQEGFSDSERVKNYARYVRYGLHQGKGLLWQWRDAPQKKIWLYSLPRGLGNYMGDFWKILFRYGKRSGTTSAM